ncbi:DctP family TRAP transporter solute-binding subunit [Evansella clarkii]|uniref:DctP family TRAP transporter solute-binding subunit n=1 Tax=Evansella clarkii TaxID=79879 RepID=UPI001EEE1E5C|nr:DctP family TRAP transporter solute-binding subunit [Evansella clarkii]
MMKKHLLKVLGTVLISTAVLTACGGGEDPADAEASDASGSDNEANADEGNDSGEAENNSAADSGDVINIKVGHIGPPTHSFTLGIEELTAAIEEETDGQVKFEIFPGGQLGGERDMVEQVQLGTLDMGIYTSAPVTNFVPELAVLDLPLIFRDHQHAYDTLDGEVGEELLSLIDAQGFKGLGLWENGMRHMLSNGKPILSADDLNGMKVRAIGNDLVLDTYRALGADPTPIEWPEVHTSLQQGIVEAHDNAYGVTHSTGIYEVQEYLSEVGLYYAAAVLLMNGDLFESLPEDVQEVFERLGKEYAHVQREMTTDIEAEQKQELMEFDNGLEIYDAAEVDIDSFREAVQPVYEKYADEFGDLVERIQAVE